MLIIVFSVILCSTFFNVQSTYARNKNEKWQEEDEKELQPPDKEWNIVFNTEIDTKTLLKNVYVLDSDDNKVKDIKIEIVDDDEIKVVPRKDYEQGETYYLCIDDGLKSTDHINLVQSYKKKFQIEKIDSNFFKIRKIEAINENHINVYFTQPVNLTAKSEVYYEIFRDREVYIQRGFKNMEISILQGAENGISIYFKNEKLKVNEEYELRILGDLTSDYGVRLLNGEGDQKKFRGAENEEENIKILSVDSVGENLIRINFNKKIDIETAEDVDNYLLKDLDGDSKEISKAVVSEDNESVTFRTRRDLDRSEDYNLTVKNIKDAFNQSKIRNKKFVIDSISNRKHRLHIKSVDALYETIIVVRFYEKLDSESAMSKSNYVVKKVGTHYEYSPTEVYYDQEKDPYSVKLYFDKDERIRKSTKYELEVSDDLEDVLGNDSYKDIVYSFEGTSRKYEGFSIENALIIGNDSIKLTFSEAIKKSAPNTDTSNYTLVCDQGENRKIILSCSDVKYVDSNTLILKFEGLNFEEEYVLNVDSLESYIGDTNESYKDGIDVTIEE
jgi:KaiC/GvpD/RAD55 family RecA-like ATPase